MESPDIYSCNIDVLKQINPLSVRRLETLQYDSGPYQRVSSRSGLPILKVSRENRITYLCSKVDPQREAERLVHSYLDGTEQLVVLFGMGLGYHLQEMLRMNSGAHFVIVEPDLELFAEILKTRDLSDILLSNNITLLIEPRGIDLDEFSPHPSAVNIRQVVLRPYRTLFETKAQQAVKDFQAYVNGKRINIATLKRFDRLWTKNTFKNCHFFFTRGGVSILRGRFRGLPAIVVAAGPSVERDLALLKQHSRNSILIAVDTVLNTLLSQDIHPDFVVTVDPQLINSYHLASLVIPPSTDVLPVLIADPAVYPTVLRTYRGEVLITSSVFSPGRIIEQFAEIKGSIAAGGSVATAAFDLARIMGADPIILMGLDLSFSGGKTHISGSYVERYIQSYAHRLKPIHNFTWTYIRGGSPEVFTDKSGTAVLSDRRMLLYRNWFERQIRCETTTVLNATRGGLSIEGIPDIAPEEIKKHVPLSVNKQGRMHEIRSLIGKVPIQTEKARRFIEYLTKRRDDLDTMRSLSAMAGAHAESLKNTPTPEVERKLMSLEERIVSFRDCSRLIDMVMQEPINEALATTPAEDMDHALNRSIELYRAIEEAAAFVRSVLEMAEKRLKRKMALRD
jgi:hypothetical protein